MKLFGKIIVVMLALCFVLFTATACDDINIIIAESGLVYEVSDDGKFAMVKGYKGAIEDVVVEESYQGVPVQVINGSAFAHCESLKSVVIPESVSVISEHAFRNCTSLASVQMTDSVIAIARGAFYGCTALTQITLPSNLNMISFSVFYGCATLKSIDIPSTVVSIMESAFYGCLSLETVNLNEGLERIGQTAFFGCVSLKDIALPSTISEIDNYAFDNCISLDEMVLPESLEYLGSRVFEGCNDIVLYSEAQSKPHDWRPLNYLNNPVYWYSEEQPEISEDGKEYIGDFWHYVEGEITIWEQPEIGVSPENPEEI